MELGGDLSQNPVNQKQRTHPLGGGGWVGKRREWSLGKLVEVREGAQEDSQGRAWPVLNECQGSPETVGVADVYRACAVTMSGSEVLSWHSHSFKCLPDKILNYTVGGRRGFVYKRVTGRHHQITAGSPISGHRAGRRLQIPRTQAIASPVRLLANRIHRDA